MTLFGKHTKQTQRRGGAALTDGDKPKVPTNFWKPGRTRTGSSQGGVVREEQRTSGMTYGKTCESAGSLGKKIQEKPKRGRGTNSLTEEKRLRKEQYRYQGGKSRTRGGKLLLNCQGKIKG